MENDIRRWITLAEAIRMPRIDRHGVIARLQQLNYEDGASPQDIRAAYE